MPPEPRISIRPDRLVWQQTGDEVVVLDLRSSQYLAINRTGRTLWAQLEAGATALELERTLVEAHGIEAAVAQADVAAFLGSLRQHDLLAEMP